METFFDYFPATIFFGSIFIGSQLLYMATFLIDAYVMHLPVNHVDMSKADVLKDEELPRIVLFYPVLMERKDTMQTTFRALSKVRYPQDRFRVIAIPNHDDAETIASLESLTQEFPFLQILEVPSTADPAWQVVWDAWDKTPLAYWWHRGRRAGDRDLPPKNKDLPPKKTRQLIYAYYTVNEIAREHGQDDFLVSYIDADSCPLEDFFMAGAVGSKQFDVVQTSNIAGNLNDSIAASWHAFDHMVWDGYKYQHLTADGKQPYWVLGKGLFFKASDLYELGGFHPWLTIEDPEVGARFWKNGRRLGYHATPLIEEVPRTIGHGITQRKRWVAGFFQTLMHSLPELGFTPLERLKAWCIFLPTLSYLINPFGWPAGAWALYRLLDGTGPLPAWSIALSIANSLIYIFSMALIYRSVWVRSAYVLPRKRDRVRYLMRCNPIALTIWGFFWCISIVIGFWMFVRDQGLIWERTEKFNANSALISE